MTLQVLTGADIGAAVHDLARLRITVFREFPYLYEGDEAYERRYLATYLRHPDSYALLIRVNGTLVGASTGMPLAAETEEVVRPFRENGILPESVFYCGESILLPEWRGRGWYKAFFAGREGHARARGYRWSAFCGVVRPETHPRRPHGYQPLDAVWARFGYQARPELATTFSWKDLDEAAESPKPMLFRLKAL